jgi:hypothetical protein
MTTVIKARNSTIASLQAKIIHRFFIKSSIKRLYDFA